MLNNKFKSFKILEPKISKAWRNTPYFVARHDFVIFLALCIIVSLLTFLYLWRSLSIAKNRFSNNVITFPNLRINQREYEKFLENSQRRQEEFWKADEEFFQELFEPLKSTLD